MSLSGEELGTLSEGGFRPCQALQNYDSAGLSARVKQIVAPAPDPIRREPRATFDLEEPVQFQEDFRASRVIDSTWPHQGNTVQVTVRGGQAHQPSSNDKNKMAQWRQERVLKTAGARQRKPQGTKPIEEPRWELLKHWYSSSEVIANWNEQWVKNWNEQWVKTDEWEKKGGHTLHWSITSWLREHFKLGSIAAVRSLTVDPSFSDHTWSLEAMTIDKRVQNPIYEMSAKEIEGYIKCFEVNVQTWVIIVRADQVQGALKSLLYKDYDGFGVTTSDRPSTGSRTMTSSRTFYLNSSCDQTHPHELFL